MLVKAEGAPKLVLDAAVVTATEVVKPNGDATDYSLQGRHVRSRNGRFSFSRQSQPSGEQESLPVLNTLRENEQFAALNPEQQHVVIIRGATRLLDACQANAKVELPWLLQKETDADPKPKDISNKHVLGLIAAVTAIEEGAETVSKFQKDWGERADYLLGQANSFLPELQQKRQADLVISPEKEAAIKEKTQKRILKASKKRTRRELDWLVTKETDPTMTRDDIAERHTLAVLDAVNAIRQSEDGIKKFEQEWGQQSDYLLAQASDIAKDLQGHFDQEHEELDTVYTPYEVRVAKKLGGRHLAGLRRRPDQQAEFLKKSAIKPQSWGKELGVTLTSAVASGVNLAGGDVAAGAFAIPLNMADISALENAPTLALTAAFVAAYIPFIKGAVANIHANERFSKETGVSTNAGYATGEFASKVLGVSAKMREKMAMYGQAGFLTGSDIAWNIVLLGLVLSGKMSPNEALITGTAASLGAASWEYGTAKGIHKFLDGVSYLYNKKHGFPKSSRRGSNK